MEETSYAGAKRIYLLAGGAMILGLAVAGSFDPTAGGAIVVFSWALGVYALHRLGRTGSSR